MSDGAAEAVVDALLRLADSGDWQDSRKAGRCLAVFGERPEAR